tara:strand:- start:7004 stop:7138 length:135 start_codon:yes stop_codon:yes gene_type:complete
MTKKIELPDWKELGILWYEYDEKIAVLEWRLEDAIFELYGDEEE